MNDRARVPFALVGVVLLVGSATFAASLGSRDPRPAPATELAIERADAAAVTALRRAAVHASRRAARAPVTDPANTSAGRVLNGSRPFRDYLRVRIYLAARAGLDRVRTRVGGVTATASVPPVTNATTLARAKRRVHVERAGPGGTALRVRIENVSVRATRRGRAVERVDRSPAFVVETPVLAVHDRVTRFDRLLDRPPTEPGLARRLTGRAYALAWTRGYAQYGGAPVSNVVANRHVELATNDALLGLQRGVFGRADPAGRRALVAAAGRVAVTDLVVAAGTSVPARRADAVLRAAGRPAPDGAAREPPVGGWGRSAPGAGTTMRVGVNRSADGAFVAFRDDNLSAVLRSVYGARVRVLADVDRVAASRSRANHPEGNWTLAETRRSTDAEVRDHRVTAPSTRPGWHVLQSYGRRVVRRRTTVRVWRRGNHTRTTRHGRVETFDVGLTVAGRHAPSDHAPRRPIPSVHERGAGPLDGPNLAGVPGAAVRRAVTERGGPDALARRAVAGRLNTSVLRVNGRRPSGLRRWVAADLAGLRDRVRNVSVVHERGALGTYAANPPAELAAVLREHRAELVAAPGKYDGVAAKARIAARRVYLDRVVARLERRADARTRTRGRVDRLLRKRGVGSLARLRRLTEVARLAPRRAADPPGLPLDVDGTPPYLPVAAVDRDRIGARGDGEVHPLRARNLNVFTMPYGDAADTIVDGLLGTRRVHLRTAARTLRAARRTGARADNRTLDRRRARLREAVDGAVVTVRERMRVALRREGVGDTPEARSALVAAGLSRWDSTAARALALTNGSAVRAVARRAARRCGMSPWRRDLLSVRLRVAVDRALATRGARPPERPVDRTTRVVRAAATELVRAQLERAGRAARERWLGQRLGSLAAGLPVAPIPGYWYATTNVWHVRVSGAYERFVVRARRGRPGPGPGVDGPLTYVRAGRPVGIDVDGDGREERLGRGGRVRLSAETAVVVVVPPGGRGVGDTGGNADERSPGWSSGK